MENTAEEIHSAIRQMKTGKTPGPDGIPVNILKTGSNKFFQCLCVYVIPEDSRYWAIPITVEKAVIVPIPKGGDQEESTSTYTTIEA